MTNKYYENPLCIVSVSYAKANALFLLYLTEKMDRMGENGRMYIRTIIMSRVGSFEFLFKLSYLIGPRLHNVH